MKCILQTYQSIMVDLTMNLINKLKYHIMRALTYDHMMLNDLNYITYVQ